MKRLASTFGCAAALATWAAPARAQGTDEFGAYGGLEKRGRYESSQSAAAEIRFGPYRPKIDNEFGGTGPFEQTFGDGTRYLIGFEVDWQLLRIPGFGSLGPGFGWGFTSFTANAPFSDGSGLSAQQTSLTIMPMYLVGVLRVDVLAKDVDIPIVPYAKLGLGYALWWVSSGSDTATDASGAKGQGSSFGWQYALGLSLLLDFFDESAAIELDNATGVNNSYFFVEWLNSDLSGFGGGRMNVGTSTWMLGLAVEF